jgi:hypothetical protein
VVGAPTAAGGLRASLGRFDESHGLMVLVLTEFLLFVLLGRRARGGRRGGEE